MSTIRFEKVTVLPQTYTANTLYIVKAIGQETVVLYFSSADGLTVSRIPNTEDLSSAVDSAITELTSLSTFSAQVEGMVADDIAALKNKANGIAGLDASGQLSPGLITELNGQDTLLKKDGEYVWDDYINPFVVKNTSGGNNPTFGVIFGNMQGLQWPKDTVTQVWVDFHIRHDFAVGSKIYPHVHWTPYTTKVGTVRWGIEYVIAKGHGQEIFPLTSTTIFIEQTVVASDRYRHMVAECSLADAIESASIEPDSVIKMRVFRDASHPNDTLQDPIHAWQADLHYQRARLGTKNKSPNFFG